MLHMVWQASTSPIDDILDGGREKPIEITIQVMIM